MAKTKPQTNGKVAKVAPPAKDAGVKKSTQKPATKAKELAKTTAAKVLPEKDSKKSKKSKKVEPEPEPESESESDVSDSDASDEEDSDESDSEAEVAAPKTNGIKKAAAAAPADSSDESDDSEDDEPAPVKAAPAKAAKVNGTAAKRAAKDESEEEDSEDEESDESDSDDEAPPQAKAAADDTSDESESSEEESDEEDVPAKAKNAKAAKVNGAAADSSDDEEEDSDESDDSSEDEEVDEAPSKKRKADAVSTPAAKKTKTEVTTPSAGEGVKNLFVGGLSWNIDEEWLAREFEEFGEIVGSRIITDRESGRSKGYGYVEFADADSAAKALEAKHESMIDGRQVRVDFSTPRQPRDQNTPREQSNQRANKFGDQPGNPTDTLFCGNLSFDTTSDVVSETFGEFGTITSVRLPTDRETGAPKGFGYISFSTVEEAKAALEGMNGEEIGGRRCRLDYAQPRTENGGGQRGGRGGFGGDRGGRGGFGGRGRGGFGDRGGRGRGGARGGRGGFTTNRGGFGDFKGNKVSFD